MKNKSELKVYRRLLKYPPWAPWRHDGPMTIKHKLKNKATITATAPEFVTVSDAEKLYAAIYYSFAERHVGEEVEFKAVIGKIRKKTNCGNEDYIFTAIERVTQLTIKYSGGRKDILFHIINRVEFDKLTGILTIKMPLETYDAFKNKKLTLNLDNYIELQPIGKNVYGFLASNSACRFRESLMFERAGITTKRENDKQKILKRALLDNKNNYIIQDFKIEKKNRQRYVIIDRNG
jgi:hypothetical protein